MKQATLTSSSHPLRVDMLPISDARVRGTIGLTFAPGKKHAGIEGRWARDLDADLDRLRATYRTDVLVCLLEDHELRSFGIPTLVEAARSRDITVLRLPIADGGVPERMADLVGLVDRIVTRASAGDNVVIHCRGGLGRTGLVGACVLVALGASPASAIATVRAARKGAIETDEQEEWVERFAGAAKRSREDFDALLRFLPIFEAPGFRFGKMESIGGHVLPSARLAPEAHEFLQALYDHHWIVPFDWPSWTEGESYVEDPARLQTADLETLEKLLTAHARADRFVEGHLLAMLDNGHITAILRRLKQLRPVTVTPRSP